MLAQFILLALIFCPVVILLYLPVIFPKYCYLHSCTAIHPFFSPLAPFFSYKSICLLPCLLMIYRSFSHSLIYWVMCSLEHFIPFSAPLHYFQSLCQVPCPNSPCSCQLSLSGTKSLLPILNLCTAVSPICCLHFTL